ncbi:DUF6412 domain-containing protein [Microbacterium sp. bgisy203]|uniref:DUF6412 domain-containing protein n=1 Tax=Microbacterium sp. bgisy203 TaxID=3413799 RepID=UPI003D722176
MIDTLISLWRASLAALGILAVPELTSAGALVTVTVLVAATLVLLVASVVVAPRRVGGARRHPTRDDERAAPLTQSDPDADGHIRRRGPSAAASAA